MREEKHLVRRTALSCDGGGVLRMGHHKAGASEHPLRENAGEEVFSFVRRGIVEEKDQPASPQAEYVHRQQGKAGLQHAQFLERDGLHETQHEDIRFQARFQKCARLHPAGPVVGLHHIEPGAQFLLEAREVGIGITELAACRGRDVDLLLHSPKSALSAYVSLAARYCSRGRRRYVL